MSWRRAGEFFFFPVVLSQLKRRQLQLLMTSCLRKREDELPQKYYLGYGQKAVRAQGLDAVLRRAWTLAAVEESDSDSD